MKLCRFQPLVFEAPAARAAAVHPAPRFGVIEQQSVRELSAENWPHPQATERVWPLEDVKLLPPSVPTKIVAVGRNFREHADELGNDLPPEPLIFLKPPSAIIAPEEPIMLPGISHRVDHEGELAVIVGRTCAQLGDHESLRPYLAGFSCLNDVTARDLQKSDGQWTRAKGFDTFCPIGPVMETELDLASVTIQTLVNGRRKQFGRASEMIFSVDVIIRWISRVMTLFAGDVVATGTPPGVGPLAAGDVVEVVVSGVGTLRNPVVAGV